MIQWLFIVYIQLNRFKYCYPTLIILFDTNYAIADSKIGPVSWDCRIL